MCIPVRINELFVIFVFGFEELAGRRTIKHSAGATKNDVDMFCKKENAVLDLFIFPFCQVFGILYK